MSKLPDDLDPKTLLFAADECDGEALYWYDRTNDPSWETAMAELRKMGRCLRRIATRNETARAARSAEMDRLDRESPVPLIDIEGTDGE